MIPIRKHFRFPIYNDGMSVKEVENTSSIHHQVIEKHHEAAVLNRKKPFMERSTIPCKDEKQFKPKQPIEMDPVHSYDEPMKTTDRVAEINNQAKNVKVQKEINQEIETKEQLADEELSSLQQEKHSEMIEEYMSFSNNNLMSLDEGFEEESIPSIKQRIRQSREMREEEVPFRRKQRNKN